MIWDKSRTVRMSKMTQVMSAVLEQCRLLRTIEKRESTRANRDYSLNIVNMSGGSEGAVLISIGG